MNTTTYNDQIDSINQFVLQQGQSWNAINPECVARMRLQNRFNTGLDIARYTAKIMREDTKA